MVHTPSPHNATAPSGPSPPHYEGYTVILRHTTHSRTLLNCWTVWGRDLYLTTYNTHKRQTSMPPEGFEPTIPKSGKPQIHALDLFVTGTFWWYIDPFMHYIFLPFICNIRTSEYWSFKKEISTKEILFWHTSELRTTVASEYVIRWLKNENYPLSRAVMCLENAWIFIFSPPSPPNPLGFVSKRSAVPISGHCPGNSSSTTQDCRSGSGSVAFSSPGYLRSPVLQPPHTPPRITLYLRPDNTTGRLKKSGAGRSLIVSEIKASFQN